MKKSFPFSRKGNLRLRKEYEASDKYQFSHKDQAGLALQAPHVWGINMSCYLRAEGMSNNILFKNSGLMTHCGGMCFNGSNSIGGGMW